MAKILTCVGTRPNLIKISRLNHFFKQHNGISHYLLHTGQHYDKELRELLLKQLEIGPPDFLLDTTTNSELESISNIILQTYKAIVELKPDLVMVPGDVNSTFACAYAAYKAGVPIAHIESGLRSFDKSMPEELNRILVDDLASLYFTTEPSANENLLKEGKKQTDIKYIGNTMIDTLVYLLPIIRQSKIAERFKTDSSKPLAICTFHRPANVDSKEGLNAIIEILFNISKDYQVIFPVHPRTFKQLNANNYTNKLSNKRIILTEPLGYIDFMKLVSIARVVITDSGGIQEETTFLNIPCITIRENTERPITCTVGSNTLLSLSKPNEVHACLEQIATGAYKKSAIPYLWDGNASERLVSEVVKFVSA